MKTIFLFTRYNPKSEDGLPEAESMILKSAIEKGLDMFPVFTDVAFIKEKEDGYYIYNEKSHFKKIKNDDIIYIRISSTMILNGKSLVRQVMTLKNPLDLNILNPEGMMSTLSNKYSTYLIYNELGLNTPFTIYIPDKSRLGFVKKRLEFPLVLKTVEGSLGNGVVLVESERQLESIYNSLSNNGKIPLIAQEYIKTDGDIRVFCFGTEIIASMKRFNSEDDFRSNFSQGAEVTHYELSENEIKEVQRLQSYFIESFGPIGTIGIDFINTDEGIYHLEINDSPGLKGINITIEESISDLLIDSLIRHYI